MQKVISRVTKIRAAYAISFTSMLFALSLTWYSNSRLAESADDVRHTILVASKLEEFLSKIKDAETGFRGYLLTRDIAYLEPYHNSKQELGIIFDTLSIMLTEKDGQADRLRSIKSLADSKLQAHAESLVQFQRDTSQAEDKSSFLFKAIMDDLRKEISEMKVYEYQLLDTRVDEVDRFRRQTKQIIVITLVLSALLMFIGINRHTKDLKARNKADQLSDRYREQLLIQIDELSEANKKLKSLQESEKMASVGRLARLIAHEVRNPLTNIGLATGELRETYPDVTEEQELYFDMINRNSTRINELLTELLNSTKVSEIVYAPTNLSTLLDQVIDLSKDRAELYGIEIKREELSNSNQIWVDAEKLKIALLNITINAIEAMSETEHPVLEYCVTEKFDRIVLSIQDNGMGMDEETRSRLFEPFFTAKPNGTGLGLTNTLNIILNHKATVDVKSELGCGTTFIIGFGKEAHQGAGM